MADARTNEYLPYSPNKDGMFQANHGYPRHYRPPYRVPYNQQPQPRCYPNLNNYCQRNFQYPPQNVGSDNMGYYRPPVYHTGPCYPRYTKQTWNDWDAPLSYRYDGGQTANSAMAQYSNAKTSKTTTINTNPQRQLSTAPTSIAQSTIPRTSMTQPSQPPISVTQARMDETSKAQPSQPPISVTQARMDETSKAQPSCPQPGITQPETSKSQYSQSQIPHTGITQASIPQAEMEQNSVTQISMSQPRVETLTVHARMDQSQNTIASKPSMTNTSITKPPLSGMAQVSLFQPMPNTSIVSTSHVKKGETSVAQPTSIASPSIAKANMSQLSMEQCSMSQVKPPSLAPSSLNMTHETPKLSTQQKSKPLCQVKPALNGISQPTSEDPSMIKVSQRNMTHTSTCDPRITKVSQPTMKQMSVTAAMTHPTEPTTAQPTKASQPQSLTSKPPIGCERDSSFLIEYPVSYRKKWKTDGAVSTPTTVNSGDYNTKVTSNLNCNSSIWDSQPYPKVTKFNDAPGTKITNGEVKHSNHDETRTKLTINNNEATFHNHKKNRWDLKDKDSGKSLLRDKTRWVKTLKSDCKVELIDYIKEFCNSNTEKCLKSENHLKLQLENRNQCNIKKNKIDDNHKESSERSSRVQMLNNYCKVSNSSEKMEGANYEYAVSENDSSEEDDDELDKKDAEELLMSMSNRSIKISRLLEEQKRLMANLHAVKHTPW